MPHLEPVLDQLIDQLLEEDTIISDERRATLDTLTDHIRSEQRSTKTVRLNFICTHNSRRSQMAQIWAHTAAAAFQVPGVETFSGGTEETAFHPNAVRAMKTLGFRISGDDTSDNPRYRVDIGTGTPTLTCYSKRFEDALSPDKPFAAVMTCSDADKNCPIVPGATSRIPLTYEDPKQFDGSESAQAAYLKTAVEIGRELLYAFRRV